MKNLLVLLALLPSLLFAQSKEFTVTGNIAGLADGEVKLVPSQQNAAPIASGMVKDGAFSLKGTVPEPGLYLIVMSNEQPQYIFMENAPITISGKQTDMKAIKIEGSASHVDFVQFNKIFNPLIGELNALAAQIQKETNEKKRNVFIQQYDSVVQKVSVEVNGFVAAKRSSFVSPFLLWVTSQVTPDIAAMEANYNLLDSNLQKSQIGKSLSEYISYSKIGAVGTDAMDFTQNDTSGKAVTLSSFKGKYVLVDFWASWCKPCRMENPNVVKAFNKFKGKNFTILGVSLDQQKEAWVKAIEKDGLVWNHVSDLQYWNNAVAQLYKIQSIPGNMLIDPTGKIVAKDLHGPELETTLAKFLGAIETPSTKPVAEKQKKQVQKTQPSDKSK